MKLLNVQVDEREYGYYDTPVPVYKFKALCTSDECRPKNRTGRGNTGKRQETGVVKLVSKSCDICPDCSEYLFWEKSVA